MKTANTSSQNAETVRLPADMRTGLGEQQLLMFALESVQEVALDSKPGLKGPPHYRPQMMLTLLGYCYATGLYGSRDIEEAIGSDPTLRYICAHTYPNWRAISQFRRQHRDWVEQHLAGVLQRAALPLFRQSPEEGSPADCQRFAAAARSRVETAIIMDGAVLD